ncbi:MAG TPA: HAMP domain-containing sensor histidine kinase, partial [Chitinophagaceae bacterium]|nr:HAMP domain-containing sensor histidine kinase [Chitinophagaceae bacterium]
MLRTKNLSPGHLSAITAAILSVPVAATFYVLQNNWQGALFILIFVFVAGYYLMRYVLESFINRKVKLIYKFIYQTKASKKEEMYYKYILPPKGLEEVKEDVEKWAEQRKEEIEVLQSNEAYRKQFLQNLSHEFKTPIFAIQGYVDTLLSGAIEDPAVNKKFLENASRNVERMVNLVNDLDAITKLESGEQPLYKQNFVIQDAIKEVFETLSIKTAARSIKTSIKKGCEQPIVVFADKEKIVQVLVNL